VSQRSQTTPSSTLSEEADYSQTTPNIVGGEYIRDQWRRECIRARARVSGVCVFVLACARARARVSEREQCYADWRLECGFLIYYR
jgi:hypothetical protein